MLFKKGREYANMAVSYYDTCQSVRKNSWLIGKSRSGADSMRERLIRFLDTTPPLYGGENHKNKMITIVKVMEEIKTKEI